MSDTTTRSTLLAKIKSIAQTACPTMSFCYDIRQMQNVLSDDLTFPAIYFEEYYASRLIYRYGWQREVTLELHFLDLVTMQGEAEDREAVRSTLMTKIEAFVEALNADGTFSEVKEFQCDPEPPMFDANATGVLLRFTMTYPQCALI